MSALLPGRSAVITGAAAGIGLGIARTFAKHGARVVIADIDFDLASRHAAELVADGFTAISSKLDVTDESSVTALVERTIDEFERVDIWVNNAGFTRDAVMQRMSADDFLSVIQVHLLGTWLGTKLAGMSMRASGHGGAIINISSIAGKVGNPGQTNYSSAKAGIVGLTKASAKELARYGVRVNAIQPGLIKTAMTDKMPPEVLERRLEDVPLGRIGEVDDVANVALFLASDLAAYVTGSVVEVAGGRHM